MTRKETEIETPTVPWLAIAVALVVLGVAVTVTLGTVEPPPPPKQPQLVRHSPADLGSWAPFADEGSRAADASLDAAEIGE